MFNVLETERIGGAEKIFLTEPDALRMDAQGHPILLPEILSDPKHKAMAAILDPGMPFSGAGLRRELGDLLSAYPGSCRSATPPLSVTLLVTQVEDLSNFLPEITDERRITAVHIGDCAAVDQPECSYDNNKTGELDFDEGMLKGVLRKCRDTLLAGAPYADTVYAQSRWFGDASLSASRSYFRTRDTLRSAASDSDETQAQLIAGIRHQAMALSLKGNAEAAYYAGCLSHSHRHALPEELESSPRDSDPDHPYRCAFYASDDARGSYIAATAGGREMAIKAFERATASQDRKLAARAWWNLAVLHLETELPSQLADWVVDSRQKSGTLEYAGKVVSVEEFRRLEAADVASAKASSTAKAIAAIQKARSLDTAAFSP
ncbi:MAG TPA: hypothetical protein VGE56_07930 [Rhodocyclaceae bacterium]